MRDDAWRAVDPQQFVHRAKRSSGVLATSVLVAMVALGVTACGPAPSGAEASASATAEPLATPAADAASTPAPPTQAPPAPTATLAPGETLVPAPGAAATPGPDGPREAPPLPSTAAQLGDAVAFDTGIVVDVSSVEPVEVEAATPGEISGPAVIVTVTARNDSARPQEVDSAVVTLIADDGEVGVGTTAGDPSPLQGVIAPGDTASGRYVFMLDPASGRELTVSVNYAAGEPVAVFTGTSS